MQYITKCYWYQKQQQQVIFVPTHTIVDPYLDVIVVKGVHGIPRSVCNRNQAVQDLQRHPICLTDSYHDSIIDWILHREKTQYERNMSVEDDE